MFQIKTILNPRDFSEPSIEAYEAACDLARANQAKVIFLHVTDKPIVSYFERASDLPPEEMRRRMFETLRLPRPDEVDLKVEHRVVEGDPIEQILAAAQQTACDLIVMGRRETSRLSRWFNGSITEDVILRADCSVLVIKTSRDRSINTNLSSAPAE